MKKKYVTTQMESYNAFGVEITRTGFETEDKELQKKLDSSPDLGFWFFQAPTKEDAKKEARAWAKKVLAEENDDVEPEDDYVEPIEVEPMSAGNIDDELEALADEMKIREDQVKAEEEAKEARRAANKLGRPKKAKADE